MKTLVDSTSKISNSATNPFSKILLSMIRNLKWTKDYNSDAQRIMIYHKFLAEAVLDRQGPYLKTVKLMALAAMSQGQLNEKEGYLLQKKKLNFFWAQQFEPLIEVLQSENFDDPHFETNFNLVNRTIQGLAFDILAPDAPLSYHNIAAAIEDDAFEKARALLKDYTKDNDSCWSAGFQRFFTGHWNRHHIGLVRDILERMPPSTREDSIRNMNQLLDALNAISLVNKSGSLATRIRFIRELAEAEEEPLDLGADTRDFC